MKIFLAGPTNLEMLEDLIGRKVGVKVHSFPLTAELVRGYMAAGHDVRIGVFSQELNQKQMLIESDCLSIAIVRSRRARESLIDWFGREVKGMSDAIVEWQPDIVHAHWTYEYARAAIRSGFPSVITAHDVPSSLFSLMRPRYYWWPKLLQGFIVSRRSRMMTGQSPYTVEGWKRGMKRIRPMALVPNGVSSSLLQLREDRHPINQLEPTFASVSNGFAGLKNISSLIDAFSELKCEYPDARLLLYGSGQECQGEAEMYAQRAGKQIGIQFIGSMKHESLLAELAGQCDVFVHPSLRESFCVSVAEAMALGIPVVAGEKAGAIPWLLDEGRAGILCDVTCPSSICAAMKKALQEPEIGMRAKGRIAEHFTIEVIIDMYLKLLYEQAALQTNSKQLRNSR